MGGNCRQQRVTILADAAPSHFAILQGDSDAACRDHLIMAKPDALGRQAKDNPIGTRGSDVLRKLRIARRLGQHLLDRLARLIGLLRIGLDVEKLGAGHDQPPLPEKRNTDRLLCCKQHVGDGPAPLDPACGCAADPYRIEAAHGGCKTRPSPAFGMALRSSFASAMHRDPQQIAWSGRNPVHAAALAATHERIIA